MPKKWAASQCKVKFEFIKFVKASNNLNFSKPETVNTDKIVEDHAIKTEKQEILIPKIEETVQMIIEQSCSDTSDSRQERVTVKQEKFASDSQHESVTVKREELVSNSPPTDVPVKQELSWHDIVSASRQVQIEHRPIFYDSDTPIRNRSGLLGNWCHHKVEPGENDHSVVEQSPNLYHPPPEIVDSDDEFLVGAEFHELPFLSDFYLRYNPMVSLIYRLEDSEAC